MYAGLHIPRDIEQDGLPNLHDMPLAERYIPAAHHRKIIEKLEALERWEITRLMILAPPGSAKSSYASVLFPAWYLGRNPTHSVIAASQTQDLAERFGRRARNLVASDVHERVFGHGLAPDQRASGHWEVEEGGEYHSTGVQPFAGRRGDLIICDDLLRGRKDADSKLVRNNTWEWILGDLRPRMKPDAKWVFITTRWHEDDPAGRILPKSWNGQSGKFTARDGEEWEVLSFAAIIETNAEADCDSLGRKLGEILWPEWFTRAMLEQERRSQGRRNWDALYQQKPKPDEGGILRRDAWRLWTGKMPACEYVMSVYDTAFEEGEENDYSARTTWGIFWHEEKDRAPRYCAIMLERWRDKVEFPKLRVLAQEHYREWKPDRLLVEKKASGHSLIQELRRNKIPVTPIKIDRSHLARAHSVTAIFDDGAVFYPDKRWADEVLDECAAFPFGQYDDLTATVIHALMFLRKQFWLEVKQDQDDDEPEDRQLNRGRLLG